MSKEILLTSWENVTLEDMKNKQIVCTIDSVSKSGMTRKMNFYFVSSGKLLICSSLIAKIAGYGQDKNGCLIVKGCGMDMVFSVLYNFNMSMLHLKGHKRNDFSHSENCRFWIDSNNYQLL
jgi:hypothetical protein